MLKCSVAVFVHYWLAGASKYHRFFHPNIEMMNNPMSFWSGTGRFPMTSRPGMERKHQLESLKGH